MTFKQFLIDFLNDFMSANDCENPNQVNDGLCGDFACFLNEALVKSGGHPMQGLSICDFVDESESFPEKVKSWKPELYTQYGLTEIEFRKYLTELSGKDARAYVGYHVWLYDGSKHYDAECLDGVANPMDLPFFKSFLTQERVCSI